MRELKAAGAFSLCLGQRGFFFLFFHTRLPFPCAAQAAALILYARSFEMVYTFSRVFTRRTFLWLVRAKHTVRIWIRQLSLLCGAETGPAQRERSRVRKHQDAHLGDSCL